MSRVAFYLASGCSGCEMTLIDLSEELVDISNNLDLVWAPLFGIGKYEDLEEIRRKYIDFTFIEGAIRLNEEERIVKLLRKKSKNIVALGICAALGGIPGIANLHSIDEVLESSFKRHSENLSGEYPAATTLENGKYELTLPELYEDVKPLNKVVDVDYYIGGCPPHYDHLKWAINLLISGKAEKGWITSGKPVCDFCSRKEREEIKMRKVRRAISINQIPENKCFLSEGIPCFGPATQGDCKGACLKVNIPCRGCGGPLSNLGDFGGIIVNMLSSLIENAEVVKDLKKEYQSLAKLFYLYSLPSALIPKKLRKYHVREIL